MTQDFQIKQINMFGFGGGNTANQSPSKLPGENGRNSIAKQCDQKFKGLLEMIEIECRSILSDSHSVLNKKKHPEVKDKLEIAIQWIQENKNKHASLIDEHLTLLVDPFFAIAESRLAKLYMQIFNIIQRLVMTVPGKGSSSSGPEEFKGRSDNEFKMSQECRERILQFFSIITVQDQQAGGGSSSGSLDEMCQIKILQIIMIFLDPNQADKTSKKFVNNVLKSCFQLFDSKIVKGSAGGSSAGSSGAGPNFGSTIVKSTLQACIRQVICIIFEVFNKQMQNILGKDMFDQAQSKERGQYPSIAQLCQSKQDDFHNAQIFSVVEDLIQNLATALFIHEQATYDATTSHKKHGSQSSMNSANASSGLNNSSLVGGMMGSISNQHVWNFRPTQSTKCALLDIVCLVLNQTRSLFVYFPKIGKIFENQIMPTLNQMVKDVQLNGGIEATQGIRVIKSVIAVIDNLSCLTSSSQIVGGDDSPSTVTRQSSNSSNKQNIATAAEYSEGESSTSSKNFKSAASQGLDVYRTINIQGLDQTILIVSQMADIEHVFNNNQKDKELTSQNVQQIFSKLNWKHLIGIEALSICFQNMAVLKKLQALEQGKSIVKALQVLSKFMSIIVLLDHKHFLQMIQHSSEEHHNLYTFSQSLSGTNLPSPSNLSSIKKMEKTYFELNRVTKLIVDHQQFQVGEDDSSLKQFLNPFHFQRLIQECVNGFVLTLKQIQAEESSVLASGNKKRYNKMFLAASSSNTGVGDQADSESGSGLQIQAVPILDLKIDSINQANRQKTQNSGVSGAATGGSNSSKGERPPPSAMLVEIAKALQELLEKLYLSVQCNSALYQDEEGNLSSPDGGSTSKHGSQEQQILSSNRSQRRSQHVDDEADAQSWIQSKQCILYAFDDFENDYYIQTKCILSSYVSIINVMDSAQCCSQRDQFVKSFCSLCSSREFVGASSSKQAQSQTSSKAQSLLTVSNIMACQALSDLVVDKFVNSQSQYRNQAEISDKNQKMSKKQKRAAHEMNHEQDLDMWSIIIETIIKIDATLPNQIDDQKKRTHSVIPQSKSISQHGGIDTSHLVDFNTIQRKVASSQGQMQIQNKIKGARDGLNSGSAEGQSDENLSSAVLPTGQLARGGRNAINQNMYNSTTTSSAGMNSLIDQKGNFNQVGSLIKLQKAWNVSGAQRSQTQPDVSQLKYQSIGSQNLLCKVPSRGYLPLKQDLVTLRQSLDKIFSHSQFCDKITMFQFCAAIQRLLSEFVSNSMKLTQIDQELNESCLSIQIIKRLMELVFVNVTRLELIWDQFVSMTNTLLQNQKSMIFKKLSIEATQALIQSYFQFKRNQKQLRKSVKSVDKDFGSESRQINRSKGDQVLDDNPSLLSSAGKTDHLKVDQDAKIEIDQQTSDDDYNDMSSENESEFESGLTKTSPEFPGMKHRGQKAMKTMGDSDDTHLWIGNNWQSTILQPLANFMLSPNVNDKLMAVRSIEKIIQLCGQFMKNDGWRIIIMNVGKASESGDESTNQISQGTIKKSQSATQASEMNQQVVSNGFKCLKLIINNYIQQLGQENFVSIFNCIQRFAQSDNENINSNLTAIGMFMNVADYTAKLTKELRDAPQRDQNVRKSDISLQKRQKINVDYIWQNLFQRMQSIGREYKSEIRRSLIQTLENIIINHGSIFSVEVWNLLLQKILIPMLKHSSDMFNKSTQNPSSSTDIPGDSAHHARSKHAYSQSVDQSAGNQSYATEKMMTPAFGGSQIMQSLQNQQQQESQKQIQSKRKKMAFDDETVMKALKENDDISWSETCIQLISSIYRAIKMFVNIQNKLSEQNEQNSLFVKQSIQMEMDNHGGLQQEKQDMELKEALSKIWQEYHTILCSLIHHQPNDDDRLLVDAMQFNKTISTIIVQIFKAQEDFITKNEATCQKFFVQHFESQIQIMEKTQQWIDCEYKAFENLLVNGQTSGSQYFNRNKSLVLKMTSDVILTLSKIYSADMLKDLETDQSMVQELKALTSKSYCTKILNFISSILAGCNQIGLKFYQFGQPYKLLNEEIIVLQFIEDFNVACSRDSESQSMYFQFLLKMMEYKDEQPQTEALIKRVLKIISTIILKGQVEPKVLENFMNPFFLRIQKLLETRYNWNLCKTMVFLQIHSQQSNAYNTSIGGQQMNFEEPMNQNIFVFLGLQIICISSYLIDPKAFKSRILNLHNETKQDANGQSSSHQTNFDIEIGDLKAQNNSLMSGQFQINQNIYRNPNEIDTETFDQNYQIKEQIWSLIVPLLKDTLLFNIEKFDQSGNNELAKQEEQLFMEVIKISQTLDMHVMNFVVNDLLPCCGQIQYFRQKDSSNGAQGVCDGVGTNIENALISIVDNGSKSSLMSSSGLGVSASAVSSSKFLRDSRILDGFNLAVNQNLSKYCLYNLFEICKFGNQNQHINKLQQSDSNEHQIEEINSFNVALSKNIMEMKRKISAQTTPILINRCKDILQKFSQDEQCSGSIKLPQSRVLEIVFVLKELQLLQKSLKSMQKIAIPQAKIQINDLQENQEEHPNQETNEIDIKTTTSQPLSPCGPSFLVDLMPTLSELIVCESYEVRSLLRLTFNDIAHELRQNQNQS